MAPALTPTGNVRMILRMLVFARKQAKLNQSHKSGQILSQNYARDFLMNTKNGEVQFAYQH